VLEALAGPHVPRSAGSDAEALVRTVEGMHAAAHAEDPWFTTPSVPNPSLLSEDLARTWELENWKLYRSRLVTLASRTSRALADRDDQRSIHRWRDVFEDAFPMHS